MTSISALAIEPLRNSSNIDCICPIMKADRNVPMKLSIPATAAEKERIARNSPRPTRRFHYRWVAAELAWRAAGLMNDGTEELADVLNTGGSWIKNHDDKGADKFIQSIERRCPNTEIGKAAAANPTATPAAAPVPAAPNAAPVQKP